MLLNRYKQLVRASAVYDLVVTAAFATPWTFQVVHQLLGQISPLPVFEPLHQLDITPATEFAGFKAG